MARYFIPQELLDGWVLEGKIELAGNQLKIVSEDRVYQLLPGVHFLKLAAGEDRLRLLDKVKTEEQLASLSAELYMSSVLIGEEAYDVQSGFWPNLASAWRPRRPLRPHRGPSLQLLRSRRPPATRGASWPSSCWTTSRECLSERTLNHVLLALAALAYCSSAMAYLWYLVRTDAVAARFGAASLLVGLLLHGTAVGLKFFHYGLSPAINLQEGLSLMAWLLGLIFWLVIRRLHLPILGAFVLPLMLLAALPALSLPGPNRPLPPALNTGLPPFHVLAAFLGEAVFGVASLIGVCYLLQERELRTHQSLSSSIWSRLPSLELLDRLNRRLVLYGFVLLSFTIVTGAFFAKGAWGEFFGWDPRELLTLLTWAVYAVLVWARQQAGWQGRRAALLTLLGFGLAMVGFLGMSLVPTERHGGSFQ